MEIKFTLEPAEPRPFHGLANVARLSDEEGKAVADLGMRAIDLQFKFERDPRGIPWAPLAPRTVSERRMRISLGRENVGFDVGIGPEHPILQRTRDLRLSFTVPSHPRNITEIKAGPGGTSVSIGADDPSDKPGRIKLLHKGGYNPQKLYVPARPFIGVSKLGESLIEKGVVAILDGRIGGMDG